MRPMRYERRLWLFALLAFTLASCGRASVPQAISPSSGLLPALHGVPTYRLIVLGDGLAPNKINNSGIVVGTDVNTNHPFEYKNGRVTELPLYPGDTMGSASDVNNHQEIVGSSLNPDVEFENATGPCPPTCGQTHAVLYKRGQVINLGSIPGVQNWSNSADLINDPGEIVGESGYLPSTGGSRQITIFAPGPVRAVPVPPLGSRGFPLGLNNTGEIVGVHFDIGAALYAYPNAIECSPPLTFLYDGFKGINNAGDTVSTAVGQLYGEPPAPSVYCHHGVAYQLSMSPSAINDAGDIIGTATATQDAVYSRGALRKISAISGTKIGRYFVSSDRAVQGYVLSVSPGDALLYSKGAYYDLNDLVPSHPGIILQNAASINNKREIVGTANTSTFQVVGWLLVPR